MGDIQKELDRQLRGLYGAGYLANQLDSPLEDGDKLLEAAVKASLETILKLIGESLPKEITWSKSEAKKFSSDPEDSYLYQIAYNQAISDFKGMLDG